MFVLDFFHQNCSKSVSLRLKTEIFLKSDIKTSTIYQVSTPRSVLGTAQPCPRGTDPNCGGRQSRLVLPLFFVWRLQERQSLWRLSGTLALTLQGRLASCPKSWIFDLLYQLHWYKLTVPVFFFFNEFWVNEFTPNPQRSTLVNTLELKKYYCDSSLAPTLDPGGHAMCFHSINYTWTSLNHESLP